jgi:solute carrier family 20 (sodium-dependent phosphate transporter)
MLTNDLVLIAWKGVQARRELTTTEILIVVFSAATGSAVLVAIFLLPYLWRRIMMEDWTLKWYMIWQGPWLLWRPPPPPTPPGMTNKLNIKDYYRGHLTPEELAYVRASDNLLLSVQGRNGPNLDKDDHLILPPPAQAASESAPSLRRDSSDMIPPRPVGPWNSIPVILWKINRILLRGLEKDVIRMQKRNAILSWDIEDMHSRTPHYDNRAEYMYSALQILTASAASFVHGANDVANSIAPLSTAYEVWREGAVKANVGVPFWILGFGGGAIALGLLTYGYHVIRNLGNRLTLISPSRGFCMEMASAITVLMATRLALPISVSLPLQRGRSKPDGN